MNQSYGYIALIYLGYSGLFCAHKADHNHTGQKTGLEESIERDHQKHYIHFEWYGRFQEFLAGNPAVGVISFFRFLIEIQIPGRKFPT